ncbi:hypothetical protein, partial [Mycobacterium kiyosense]|uniref:hypothetical protein n=1 Tax=Mycobacterium kiyosense TaxID=2871094 RepID=UPI00222F3816
VAARDHSLRRRLSHHLLAEVVPNQAVTVVLSQVDIEIPAGDGEKCRLAAAFDTVIAEWIDDGLSGGGPDEGQLQPFSSG